MHPTPSSRPNLTRKSPLTEMPTGLRAALSRGLLITS
jgi:hypothetical protein